mmetsp:Transcript_41990/g.119182  ORF Transcript_41990/g.119182 Transcript_41990/m.119182 type:complete len:270 (-) Transcript_41990:708-1517(-)
MRWHRVVGWRLSGVLCDFDLGEQDVGQEGALVGHADEPIHRHRIAALLGCLEVGFHRGLHLFQQISLYLGVQHFGAVLLPLQQLVVELLTLSQRLARTLQRLFMVPDAADALVVELPKGEGVLQAERRTYLAHFHVLQRIRKPDEPLSFDLEEVLAVELIPMRCLEIGVTQQPPEPLGNELLHADIQELRRRVARRWLARLLHTRCHGGRLWPLTRTSSAVTCLPRPTRQGESAAALPPVGTADGARPLGLLRRQLSLAEDRCTALVHT